jgi:DNA-directed RNA polymerase specialized sigma subunit
LPERQYEVVYRRYYLEQPFREIGEALGISEDNSKKIHRRALEKLKNLDNVSLFGCSHVQLSGGEKHNG